MLKSDLYWDQVCFTSVVKKDLFEVKINSEMKDEKLPGKFISGGRNILCRCIILLFIFIFPF